MGFGTIQLGGLSSGLDTGSIINALLAVESIPIQSLESKKSIEEQKLSLIGTFEGLVSTLQTAVQTLADSSTFFSNSLTSTDETIASFSLLSGAQSGSHTLTVNSLAAADSYVFDAVADDTANLGVGSGETVDFTYNGTNYSVAIDSATSSLNDIAAAINSAAGDEVTASVINVGTTLSPSYQMVVTGDDTGADYAITGLTSTVSGLVNPTQIGTAANAQVVVDGLTVERADNLFTDVLPGVTFTAQQAGTTNFTVAVDTEATKDQVNDFITAYNAVIDFINTQNSYDADDGAGGVLFGDNALSSVKGTLTTGLFDVDLATVQADTTGYSTLGLIGIDLQSDGTLLMDDTTFDEKFQNDSAALANLFTDATNGLAVNLDAGLSTLVDEATDGNGDPIDGVFERRKTTLNDLISDYDDQIDELERRLDEYEQSLVLKYANLENLMAGLNAQSSALAAMTLPGIVGS
jgi:flagellar hook-associated protein 2